MDNNNVVTKQVTSGTKVEAIGTVKTVVGEVKAVDPSGNERILQAGDKVYPNETIMTAVGALVLIEFINGTHLDLPSSSQIVLDTDVFDPSLAKAATGELTAEQIQEMIARGEDPTAITEATAAGAGAGDEGGSSFIVVDFNNTQGDVTSGFNTLGIPGPESTTFTELPPVEDESVPVPVPAPASPPPPPIVPSTVSVSVALDVEIGSGNGEGGTVLIPPGTVIPVGGVTAIDIPEGTSDGGFHPVTFLITLSAPSTEPITITYTINSGTAFHPDDYFDGAMTGTITIPAGYLGFTVTENIVEDMLPETNETFTIVLSNPIGATLINDTATVTIIDDDVTLDALGGAGDETDGVVTLSSVLTANFGPGDTGSIALSATGATWTPGTNTLAANDGSWTLVVNNDGTYTFTQLEPLTHSVTTDYDDPFNIQVTAAATDSAGNTSTPVLFTITVDDDGPSISLADVGMLDLIVDETILTDNASASFAGVFSGDYGMDGAGTTTYSLGVSAPGADTGMVDSATGEAVLLRMSGNVVEGYTEDTNQLVFTVSVNGSGTVTLDQLRAVEHDDPEEPDEGEEPTTLLSSDLITLTATITDADGDSEDETVGIGGALAFEDDGPSVTVNAVAAADLLTVDESNYGLNATADFSNNFSNTPSYGADGAGTVASAYTLGIRAPEADSGLVDSLTGEAVILVMNGTVVEGRTETSNALVFTVSVDSSGTVTLDQSRAVMHDDPADSDEAISPATLSAADLITLTRTDTITDADGDSNTGSASIDIGTALKFEDDGPSITVNAIAAADALVVDETALGTNASANFADNFGSTPTYGADGAGTVSSAYTLGLNAGATGLVDTLTGQVVVLSMNGGVVEGRTAVSNELVFTVSVDASGTVTLDQPRAVVHDDPLDPDESSSAETLDAANLVTLTRTDTITDKDGDTNTDAATIDIGTALKFEDDGPVVENKTDLVFANDATPSGTGVFDYTIGTDGRIYTGRNSDFSTITLAGMVGGVAILSPTVTASTLVPESSTQATFDISFQYSNGSGLTTATGTLVFDKVAGTYTVTLDQQIESFDTLTLGNSTGITEYQLVAGGSPEIAVAQLASDFYIQFTSESDPGGGGTEFRAGTTDSYAASNTSFVEGEVFNAPTDPAQVQVSSGSHAGVNGNTMQGGEILDMNFYVTNPTNTQGGASTAFASGMFLKLDGVGATTDLVILLKLVDPDTNAETTRLVVVDAGDIYKQGDVLPAGYTGITLDSNDGLIIINSDDFNTGGENYVISGLQVLTSTEGISGTGIDLSNSGASTGTETLDTTADSGNNTGGTYDGDNFKITDVGFVRADSIAQDTELEFNFLLSDADGDTTSTQTLNVSIESSGTFTGSLGADSITGSAGNDILTGDDGSDIFSWNAGDVGTDTITDFVAGSGGDLLNLSDLLVGESQSSASLADGGYLSFNYSGGNTTITIDTNGANGGGNAQTIVLEGVDLTAGNTLTAADIVTNLLTDGNLKTDV